MSTTSYTITTLAYWVLMLTDGALRMLVLLHFHALGFTPDKLAYLFLLYEFAGIITNLLGGWLGSRFGLKITLFSGLALQIIALLSLTLYDPNWTMVLSVCFVMLIQCLAGIAKDLTKMSSKSAVRLLVKESDQPGLFKLVAILTGSKNAIKGIGFFLGGLLLTTQGFDPALKILALSLAITLVLSLVFIRGDFGQMKIKVKFTQLFSKSKAINYLSLARASLFASRDAWFVVGLPIFLRDSLNWKFSEIGAFMAIWIIGYGLIQALAPRLIKSKNSQSRHSKATPQTLPNAVQKLQLWGLLLVAICILLTLFTASNFYLSQTLIIGLFIFGFIFAINSSIHSYLILAYTNSQEVAINVGYYYMANAFGRLIGTLISGLAYHQGGLTTCLISATLLTLISSTLNQKLPQK